LNEIFADYFISEFDDPLNAYTSSMANYSGAAAAVALAQKQQQVDSAQQQVHGHGIALPTGGIKTAFHAGVGKPSNNGPVPVGEPVTKRLKEVSNPAHVEVYSSFSAPPVAANVEASPSLPVPPPVAATGIRGLSGRLGFTMAGGQLALHRAGVPGSGTAAPPQVTPAAAPAAAPVSAGGIPLPVGIGIRLGGVGGVAPAMAQAAVRPIAGQYMMWGGQPPGVNMSEQAVSERRQRNREHAKRSRVRKKFMLESLQEQVRGLQKENVHLRMLIQQKIPHASQQILSECCTPSPLFSDPDIDLLGPIDDDDPKVGKRKKQPLVKADFSLMASLTTGQQNFVLSDPRLPDNPIVYASPGFYVTTGYTQDQVLGRNCRFLQGPGTDPRAVDIIRSAVASGSDASTCLLNYKADGTPFWNQFFVAALRDSDNCIVNYVSSMCCMFYFTCVCSRFTQVNAFVSSSRLESNAK
jgi:PAS domain-containing protein